MFRERGREGKKRVKETSLYGCLSCAPYWGPGLQPSHVCALTGNQTSNPLVCRPVLNPLSYSSQGRFPAVFDERWSSSPNDFSRSGSVISGEFRVQYM